MYCCFGTSAPLDELDAPIRTSRDGESNRNEVSQFLLEPFINYTLVNGWFLIRDSVPSAHWRADADNRCTVPVSNHPHLEKKRCLHNALYLRSCSSD